MQILLQSNKLIVKRQYTSTQEDRRKKRRKKTNFRWNILMYSIINYIWLCHVICMPFYGRVTYVMCLRN